MQSLHLFQKHLTKVAHYEFFIHAYYEKEVPFCMCTAKMKLITSQRSLSIILDYVRNDILLEVDQLL
jgi:hypothetical protein